MGRVEKHARDNCLQMAPVANPCSKLTDHHETGFNKHTFRMHSDSRNIKMALKQQSLNDSTNPIPHLSTDYIIMPFFLFTGRSINRLITKAATPQYTSRSA